jgi:putative ABC transport system ATP-binding protein
MKDIIIEGHGLKRYYERGSQTVKALDGVDIVIRKGEIVAILGPSGSGKTTLMNVLSCLDAPTDGTLTVAGKSLAGPFRRPACGSKARGVGICFSAVLAASDSHGNGERRAPTDVFGTSGQSRKTRQILAAVGLSDRANHLSRELSGGQMQRVAIARALIVDPKILVADEPTGNLDKKTGESIIALFKRLAVEEGLALLLTTHNSAFGAEADRIITLEDGRIVTEENRHQAPSLATAFKQ